MNDGHSYLHGRWAQAAWLCLLTAIAAVGRGDGELAGAFQAELDALHGQYRFPGATAAFALPDGSVHVAATGMADVELGIAMVPESRMLAASIGKTFVAATVVALAREGRLSLDAPISDWLDGSDWFARLPNHANITVRHLLRHQSGLPDHVHLAAYQQAFGESPCCPGGSAEPEQAVDFILDQPALFAAGAGWAYTDTGYILLGLIIEQAAERAYYDEVRDRFLDPLGLTLTTPSDRCQLPGLAAGYTRPDNDFGLPAKSTRAPGLMAWNPAVEWTGGGLVSNSRDLVLWASALFEGRAMSGAYLDDVMAGVPVDGPDSPVRYGAGVAIRDKGPLGPSYGHGGWIPGYVSSVRYYPEYRMSVAFQINSDVETPGQDEPLNEAMELRLARVIADALGRR
jgi:D-alanyl-D-alanine carboxypeptidase